jgi:hypothetical protein
MTEYGYRSLMVWQKAKTLAVEIYRLTRAESICHDFSLIAQCLELGKMLGALIRARNNPSPRAQSLEPQA